MAHPPVPIGAIIPTMADLYDVNGETVGASITAEYLRQGWLPLDGQVYNTAEYPELARRLGKDLTSSTFQLADMRGRVPMGWDTRSPIQPHSDDYKVGDVGGFRRHGKTENNHHDHNFTIDLEHTHPISPRPSTDYCLELPIDGVCEVGTPTPLPDYTGTPGETGSPEFPGDSDGVPDSFAPDAEQGEINRSGTGAQIVAVTLKHRGDDGDGVPDAPGEGNVIDDVDNRPPFLVVNWIIRAR
jgi:hypothetical protein